MKVGVIGMGRIGNIHFNNLLHHSSIDSIVTCDPKQHELGNNIEQFADWNKMIDRALPDAVFICSPTPTHFEIIKYCSEKKIHVFCEKPVDLNIEKIKLLKQIISKSGIICQVGFNRRFDPDFAFIKYRIKSGEIGMIHQITITSRDPGLPSMDYIASSGGMMMDMTIHDFDMCRFLTGAEVSSIYTTGSVLIDQRLKNYNDIDTAASLITLTNGATCTIVNSRAAVYGYDQRIEVFGSLGMISVDNIQESRTKLWAHRGVTASRPLNFFLERYAASYKIEMESFINAVINNDKVKVDIEDTLQATLIAEMAIQSIKTGQVVYI